MPSYIIDEDIKVWEQDVRIIYLLILNINPKYTGPNAKRVIKDGLDLRLNNLKIHCEWKSKVKTVRSIYYALLHVRAKYPNAGRLLFERYIAMCLKNIDGEKC